MPSTGPPARERALAPEAVAGPVVSAGAHGAPVSGTSSVGSARSGLAGATFGTGGAGSGAGSGSRGEGRSDGAGEHLESLSGDTRVLPFMDGMAPPKLLSKVEPEYTREALAANAQGLLLVKCVITTAGALVRCRIVKGIPLMNQAVLRALARWRYAPVSYQGKPVAVEYVIPVQLVAP
jgi:protein TonB